MLYDELILVVKDCVVKLNSQQKRIEKLEKINEQRGVSKRRVLEDVHQAPGTEQYDEGIDN